MNDATATAETTIYFVRHGETDWNATGRCQGQTDVPMNAAGIAQARDVARQLAGVSFDAAYTSTLDRARATAEEILRSHGLRALRVPELIELSYGDLQGTDPATWDASFRAAWENAPWTIAFPNGESLAMVQARAIPALERIVAAHPGETVIIVGHGHVNRVLALHLLGRTLEDFWSIEQPNGCVLTIRVTPRGVDV